MAGIRVERQERIEIWTLDREEARNALSRALVNELAAQVERVSADRDLTAVVLTGAGQVAFCAGADLKERRGMTEPEVQEFLRTLGDTLRAIEASDRIFIAALNGVAFGGGTELALACDLRVATPGVKLGLTEVTLGIIPGGGGTQRLARLIGPGRAKDLILTGRALGSEEAYAMGLVNRLAERRNVREEAVHLAQVIAKNAPVAVAAAKHAIDLGQGLPLADGLAIEQREYQKTLQTRDRLEGLAAFAEHRPPRYTGE